MRTLKHALAQDAVRRDTTLVPPLRELLVVLTLFGVVSAMFAR